MAVLKEIFSSNTFYMWVTVSTCLYFVTLAIYRLYFSPLAKFPGPKLAGLTFNVEFYHDVIRRGQYTFEIAKMHEKYGPIVRITPDQLHIHDPDYFEHVYPGPQKPTEKHAKFTGTFVNPTSIFSTAPHLLHKLRRSPMNPFFAKRTVAAQAVSIQRLVDKLCARFTEFRASQQPLTLQLVFTALTADIISLYCFGESYDVLSRPNFDPEMYQVIASGGELALLLRQYPWVFTIFMALPRWIVVKLNSPAMYMMRRRAAFEIQARAVLRDIATIKSFDADTKPPTVFHSLASSDIPESERSLQRLVDEAVTLVGAGTVTTADVISTTSYFILANPLILQTLQNELQTAIPDPLSPPGLIVLEHLPYLTAVIKEGLRLTHAISHRNARIAPDRALQYKDWTIPAGTVVNMTTYLLHVDPNVYPKPQEFLPQRWLVGRDLEKYLLPFGKGTRMCLGMNLAYAELYQTLAAVFRRFDMKLYQTTRRDVDIAHDLLSGTPALDSKGVRVTIVGIRD